MQPIFRDDSRQQQLDRDGWVLIPFLEAAELAELRAFYDEMHPTGEVPQMRDGIHMTIWCSDLAYKKKIRDRLREILQPACERNFVDYRFVAPVFTVKSPGEGTTFPIHQDWNIVDERCHRAFNLWIPLYDAEEEDGALWIVPGSHRLRNAVRGPGYLFPYLYDIEDCLRAHRIAVPTPAGHANVFYHRVIHGSPPNRGQAHRPVAQLSVLPADVPLRIYFQKDAESPLQVFHPEDDWIYFIDNVRDDTAHVPPKGEPVEVHPPLEVAPLKPEDVERL